ncbi:MAG: hypothetical protein HGA45_41500, partial [Chloroflexales bacterium]|nr:hypothetical protein [Chloroflexales bacterium]
MLWALGALLAWDGRPELWALLQRAGSGGPPPQVLLDYLLGQLQDRPYLICLDDLQHAEADPMILRCIEGLEPLARVGGPQLLITTRHALSLRWPSESITLSGLELAAARELLARSGLDLASGAADQLIAATEGNPQLLILAADALRRSGQPARLIGRLAEVEHIERYLLREVDSGLAEDERAAMRAIAALLGAPGPRDLLEEIAGLGLRRPLRALLDRHLIIA